ARIGGVGGGGDECGGIDVVDLNADGTADGDGFRFQGNTGAVDNFAGSCTVDEGGDQLLKFTATKTSLWVFSTAETGGETDTVLYALTDCLDGFSEVACNDDTQGTKSQIAFEMNEGDSVYLIVDLFAGLDATPYTLTAQPVTATAPALDAAEVYYNGDTGAIGVRMSGSDPEADVATFTIQLFASNDEVIAEGTLAFEDFDGALAWNGADFTAELNLGFTPGADLQGVRLSVTDAFGLESGALDVPVAAPVEVARGGACELGEAFAACAGDDACIDADAEDGNPGVCSETFPANVTGGEAFANVEAGLLGIRVTGEDADNNPDTLAIVAFDAAGAELPLLAEPGEAIATLDNVVAADGNFSGQTVVAFFSACLPAAQAQFDECVGAGGDQDACVDAANALLAQCNRDTIARVASLRVAAGDSTGRTGDAYTIEMVSPTPTVGDGVACDAATAFAICEEGLSCFGLEDPNAPTCQVPVVECPAPWGVVSLNDHAAGDGAWSYDGDSTGAENLAGAGTCGGGGAQQVVSFTAPAAGTYVAEITAADDPTAGTTDTLIFARSHCALPGEDFEVGCNDDIDTQGGNYLSSVTLELDAGQSVFLFIDGYTGNGAPGFAGTYTIEVFRQ
ncbi:MAG: hypothetical protein KC549_05155, partial [Myxococcales bacterium]|nr:hypothetical protein [Myxococcales bacterium]